MQRQRYLPDNEAGVNDLLIALDTHLPGDLATKYEVSADDLRQIRQARLVYGWFIDALETARTWTHSLTTARDRLSARAPGAEEDLPGLPMLPPIPTLPNLAPPPATVPVKVEPAFFSFLSRLVQQIKSHPGYDPSDGILLKIVGAEVPPPDPEIVPQVRHRLSPSGRPLLSVKRGQFQGYTVFVARGGAPAVEVGFSTARSYEIPLPLPATGTAEIWTIQVQYRYRNEPFGHRSLPLILSVQG